MPVLVHKVAYKTISRLI